MWIVRSRRLLIKYDFWVVKSSNSDLADGMFDGNITVHARSQAKSEAVTQSI